jgi:hypothetical protein
MLNLPVLKFYELAAGSSIHVVLSKFTGISERTLRAPGGVIRPSTIEKAQQHSQEFIRVQLAKVGYSDIEIDNWIEQHPSKGKPGALYSDLIYQYQINEGMAFPHTIDFAKKIDELSLRLSEARAKDDFMGFKEAIFCSIVADPVYFTAINEKAGLANPPMLNLFNSANDWDEMETPLQAVIFNTLVSLLAQWDIEFSIQYFPSFSARPCFSMVLPQLDPVARYIDDYSIVKRRGMFWYPVRRLIDMMCCLGMRYQDKCWPDKLKAIDILTNEAPQNLVNWRDGTKKFTARDFSNLWQQLCPERKHSNGPMNANGPWPIFVAAILWQNLLVSITSKEKSIIIFENDYLAWWERHRNDLETKGCVFGETPWPACFKEI